MRTAHAPALLAGHEPEAAIADKRDDTDAVVVAVEELGADVIPPKSNRVEQREYCAVLYTAERCVNRFEQYRRNATRFKKTAHHFLGMSLFVAITIWLRRPSRLL